MELTTGDFIRVKREQLGISRRSLSLGAKLSESYVGKIESGAISPSLASFAKIAIELRLTQSEITMIITMEGRR